ncbi:MAG: hypothetical protein R2780_14875 [Crocinitomicaceae bacterium]|nr:hypothetical protein [Crocinitomicaceae bacterium]
MNNQVDLFDHFIQVTFILLILSMITEKITNFIKLNFPDNKLKKAFNWDIKLSNNASMEDYEDVAKNKKNREIQTLATIIGVAIAYGCRANIFRIYDTDFEMGWLSSEISADYFKRHLLSDFFGCGLTGLFLSLGSKFFHDLLGLLLESKNLKRKLTDREGVSNLQTIDEVDKYIAEVEPIVVESHLNQYLRTIPAFQHFEYSETDDAADVYLGEISEDELHNLQPMISVPLANKTTKQVALNYILI